MLNPVTHQRNLYTNQSRLYQSATLLLAALPASACASTKPVAEWRNENFTGELSNILVIAVTLKASRRRDFEDGFVGGLAA